MCNKKPMPKDQLRKMLAHLTDQYQLLENYEVTVYAPKDPAPKRMLDQKPGKATPNIREQEWQEFLEQVEAGTYRPVSKEQYQEAVRKAGQAAVRRKLHDWQD